MMKVKLIKDKKRDSEREKDRRACPQSERGIALVMVLILSAVALGIMAALVYMLIAGTQVSGIQKRYRTALEAGKGGAQIAYELLAVRGNPNLPGILITIPASGLVGPNGDCLTQKLNNGTPTWDPVCSSTLAIDPATQATYDWTFQLGDATFGDVYTVYAKIANTTQGNSGGDLGLSKGGVVASNSGEIAVVSRPYLYTLEVDVENATNKERAKYSILYQY